MIYVSNKKIMPDGQWVFHIKCTENSANYDANISELQAFIEKGNKVAGYCEFGIFPLNLQQLKHFECYLSIIKKFNAEVNNGRYTINSSIESMRNCHKIVFEDYTHGVVCSSITIEFELTDDGDIIAFRKDYDSFSAATISGYTGTYSEKYVLYANEKPTNRSGYHYYRDKKAFYNKIKTLG